MKKYLVDIREFPHEKITVGDKFLRQGKIFTCCYGQSYIGLGDDEIPESGIITRKQSELKPDIKIRFVLHDTSIHEKDRCIRLKTGELCTCVKINYEHNLGWFKTDGGEYFDAYLGHQVIKDEPIFISEKAKFIKLYDQFGSTDVKIKECCPECGYWEEDHLPPHNDHCPVQNDKNLKFVKTAFIRCDKCDTYH